MSAHDQETPLVLAYKASYYSQLLISIHLTLHVLRQQTWRTHVVEPTGCQKHMFRGCQRHWNCEKMLARKPGMHPHAPSIESAGHIQAPPLCRGNSQTPPLAGCVDATFDKFDNR